MKKDLGFTFIEIMVCVVILSVGLLGLMALQAMALKNSMGSYHKVQANLLAHSIADRVRLNFVTDPNTTAAELAENNRVINQYLSKASFSAQAACYTSAGCDRRMMAQNDIYEWKKTIRDILPIGQARITCRNPGGACASPYDAVTDVFTVTISWDDNRNGVVDNIDSGNITPGNATPICLPGVAQPALNPPPFQFDPCFRMDFKL
jgi:type IV pilus assembly protein PilV